MILLTRKERRPDGTATVVPEEIIARVFSLMVASETLEVTECTDLISSDTDSLHGQYPLLIHKHWTIPKQYIFSFFREATQIDKTHTLTPEMSHAVVNLTDSISSRLALTVRLNHRSTARGLFDRLTTVLNAITGVDS